MFDHKFPLPLSVRRKYNHEASLLTYEISLILQRNSRDRSSSISFLSWVGLESFLPYTEQFWHFNDMHYYVDFLKVIFLKIGPAVFTKTYTSLSSSSSSSSSLYIYIYTLTNARAFNVTCIMHLHCWLVAFALCDQF